MNRRISELEDKQVIWNYPEEQREHNVVLKKKEIFLHTTTWMNLKGIMLSAISQLQKGKYCMILFFWL